MGLTNTQKILIILARSGCKTLDELEEKLGISRDELKVYLSILAKKGIIYRKWRRFGNKKFREYCLKEYYKY